jgi:hypothetical protein
MERSSKTVTLHRNLFRIGSFTGGSFARRCSATRFRILMALSGSAVPTALLGFHPSRYFSRQPAPRNFFRSLPTCRSLDTRLDDFRRGIGRYLKRLPPTSSWKARPIEDVESDFWEFTGEQAVRYADRSGPHARLRWASDFIADPAMGFASFRFADVQSARSNGHDPVRAIGLRRANSFRRCAATFRSWAFATHRMFGQTCLPRTSMPSLPFSVLRGRCLAAPIAQLESDLQPV